jgi:hypothetical protein
VLLAVTMTAVGFAYDAGSGDKQLGMVFATFYALGCVFAVLALSACGSKSNPPAGSIPPAATTAGHARLDDPRTKHVACLRQHNVPFQEVGATGIQVGSPSIGPSVVFTPTPGAAQRDQIVGQAPGAEVIGSALLYPNQASDRLLSTVEHCLAQGVKG